MKKERDKKVFMNFFYEGIPLGFMPGVYNSDG